MRMYIRALACMASLMTPTTHAHAQYNEMRPGDIASLQVVAGNNWLEMPVIRLHDNNVVNIAFDDLTHEYRRYAYRLEHCEADWSKSEGIFDSDFCEGFVDGNTIDNCEESKNTNTLYTHYRFAIPNEKCGIKMSGNYKVYVYDENSSDTVLTACFMVEEPLMNVTLSATANTDIDVNKEHQQVDMKVDFAGFRINDAKREIKTVVLQNGNWMDARRNAQPQYTTGQYLAWQHNRELIFNAGNEYRKFEILDVTHPTLGIENVWWDGENYNAQIWTDMPRRNYNYDEDANGAFYIRNSDNIENDCASEYVNVEFRLNAPRQNGDVYVNGVWTDGSLKPRYKMAYSDTEKIYKANIKLKQGYYSYRYIVADNNKDIHPVSTEGNFFQTENKYQALVYYKGIGKRTDLLVGYREIRFK